MIHQRSIDFLEENIDDSMVITNHLRESLYARHAALRRSIRERLSFHLPQEMLDVMIPGEFKKIGTIRTCVRALQEGYRAEDIILFLRDTCQCSGNACTTYISGIRKELLKDPSMEGATAAQDLLDHPLYRGLLAHADEEQYNALLSKESKDYPKEAFGYETVKGRLSEIIEAIREGKCLMTFEVMVHIYINFCARVSELHLLNLRDGTIGGQLKQRGDDRRYPYEGIVSYDEAELLLSFVKENEEFHVTTPKKRGLFNQYLKERYSITSRDLRVIGSTLIASRAENRVEKLMKKSKALRHRDLETSILHYYNEDI